MKSHVQPTCSSSMLTEAFGRPILVGAAKPRAEDIMDME